MKKILITGAAGFIGFHLVEKLANYNFNIIGLDNINNYYDVNLKYARLLKAGISKEKIKYNTFVLSNSLKEYRFIKLDLIDKENIVQLFKNEKFDYVVHLAAQAGVRHSLENPQAYIDSNVTGFLNILEACKQYPVKHLVFASSSSVYGNNKKLPFSENDNTDTPRSIYAATKKMTELMAYTYSHLYGIKMTGLRFFTVYGPWGRPDMAYFIFTKSIIEGKIIKVFNKGKMQRDFTYIDDVVVGIKSILSNKFDMNIKKLLSDNFNIFNIGNHKTVELKTLITIIEKYLNKKAILDMQPIPPGDVDKTYADISKLQSLRIELTHRDLKYGIKKFIDWYHENQKIING